MTPSSIWPHRSLLFARCTRQLVFLAPLALLAVASGCYVIAFGSQFPFFDDLPIVASLPADGTLDASTLLTPFNGFITPMQVAATWVTWFFCGGNLRPLLFASTLVFILSSGFCLAAVRKLRGRPDFDDWLVPLACLGTAHWIQLIWAINFYLIAAVASGCAVLLLGHLWNKDMHPGRFTALCLATILLGVQGGAGLLMALGLLPFLAVCLVTDGESLGFRNKSVAFALTVTFLVVFLVFQLQASGADVAPRSSVLQKAKVALQVLANLLPGLGQAIWPISGLFAVCLFVATAWALFKTSEPGDFFVRPPYKELSLLLPPVALAAGIGFARGYENGFKPHYATLMIPAWVTLLAAWAKLPQNGLSVGLSRTSLVLLAVATGLDFRPAIAVGRQRRQASQQLEKDIADGRPLDWIAAEHSDYWRFGQSDLFAQQLDRIRVIGKGALGMVADSPRLEFTAVDTTPTSVWHAVQCEQRWLLKDDAAMHFAPAKGNFSAVRIKFRILAPGGSAYVAIAAGPSSRGGRACHAIRRRNIPLIPVWDVASMRSCSSTVVFDEPTDSFVFYPHNSEAAIVIDSIAVAVRSMADTE